MGTREGMESLAGMTEADARGRPRFGHDGETLRFRAGLARWTTWDCDRSCEQEARADCSWDVAWLREGGLVEKWEGCNS